MDEVTYFKTRFRKEQWEKLITDYQSSSLKVDDWCVQNHISRHAYYYWLRKIRKEACESILPTFPKRENEVTFANWKSNQLRRLHRQRLPSSYIFLVLRWKYWKEPANEQLKLYFWH